MSTQIKYDVALSFAGEDRPYVEQVAERLLAMEVKVFYDAFETVDIWGKDLYTHLSGIYQRQARYTVIFISRHYRDKVWTNHERRAAQARALTESQEYILPARFDDTEIDGILSTTGNIDLREVTPAQLCCRILEKLGRDPGQVKADKVPSPQTASARGTATFNYSNYNGRYRIGDGVCLFETRWSKASGTAIYCYNETPSVRGVALVPKGSALTDITDASKLDYTSRTRTVEEGGWVVLQNVQGFYAALKVIDVKDDSREDPVDELTIKFWILTDGSKDFSSIENA